MSALIRILITILAALSFSAVAVPLIAQEKSPQPLPTPKDAIILTISGEVPQTNQGAQIVFDLSMLEQLPMTAVKTTTIWTDGEQNFKGVLLADLLQRIGVQQGTLKATAINDYSVSIPVSDAVNGGPIIAYARNDKPMSIRDKGPLWIVYPYDSSANYRTEVIYSRSIWQLDRIEIIQ